MPPGARNRPAARRAPVSRARRSAQPAGRPARAAAVGLRPPGYDDEPGRRYPSVYMIQGLTGQLDMWRNRSPFRRNFPSWPTSCSRPRRASLHRGLVDAWTSYGGAQFLDSPGTGGTTPTCATKCCVVDDTTAPLRRPSTAASPASRAAATAMVTDAASRSLSAVGHGRGRAQFGDLLLPDFGRPPASARRVTTGRSRSSGRTSAAARRSAREATHLC